MSASPPAGPVFTRPEAWTGGSYELLLAYGPLPPPGVQAVLARLWAHPTLQGCYLETAREPADQPRVDPAGVAPEGWLHGVATLPGGGLATCGSYVFAEAAATWVYFGVPLGSLGYSHPVGAFPFDDGRPLDWRAAIDAWLVDVAAFVHAAHPIRRGFVGWIDALDTADAALLTAAVPARRWEGYVVPEGGALAWHPPTEGAPVRLG